VNSSRDESSDVFANACEDVSHFSASGYCVTHAVSCEEWQAIAAGDLNHQMIASFLVAIKMALQFRIDVLFTEQINQPFGDCLCIPGVLSVSGIDGARDWTIKTTCQTDEAFGMCSQLVGSNTVLALLCVFRHTQLHQGD
jgi:hypothetical protein